MEFENNKTNEINETDDVDEIIETKTAETDEKIEMDNMTGETEPNETNVEANMQKDLEFENNGTNEINETDKIGEIIDTKIADTDENIEMDNMTGETEPNQINVKPNTQKDLEFENNGTNEINETGKVDEIMEREPNDTDELNNMTEETKPSETKIKPKTLKDLKELIEQAIINSSVATPQDFEITPHERNLQNIEYSSTCRKRLHGYLTLGYTVKDAKLLAQFPGAKGYTPKLTQERGDQYKVVNVAIKPPRYPRDIWGQDSLMAIKQCIETKIRTTQDDEFNPRFFGCWVESGWLKLGCRDKKTAKWLHDLVPTLTPWQGAQLTSVDEINMEKFDFYAGFFPGTANSSEAHILSFIESENRCFNVKQWKIIRKERRGFDAKVTFAVDVFSTTKIKLRQYELSYGLATVQLHPKYLERKVPFLLEKVNLKLKIVRPNSLEGRHQASVARGEISEPVLNRSHRRAQQWKLKRKERKQKKREIEAMLQENVKERKATGKTASVRK